ncbi:hypothetical protein, partial [Frankia sp. CiP1_Cm_nod1]
TDGALTDGALTDGALTDGALTDGALTDDALAGRLADGRADSLPDDATTPLTLNARPAGSHRRKRGR